MSAPGQSQQQGAGGQPRPTLTVFDAVAMIVGIVIGVGIFKAPSIVAGNTSSGAEFLGAWVLGGVISLCGALVYAELATRHPETGGEYAFLSRGLGRGAGFSKLVSVGNESDLAVGEIGRASCRERVCYAV